MSLESVLRDYEHARRLDEEAACGCTYLRTEMPSWVDDTTYCPECGHLLKEHRILSRREELPRPVYIPTLCRGGPYKPEAVLASRKALEREVEELKAKVGRLLEHANVCHPHAGPCGYKHG